MLKVKVSVCVLWLLLVTGYLKAQENSPYTRYGIGNLSQDYSSDLAGYGGLTAASEDEMMLNFDNPASYGSLRLTTLSTGLYITDIRLSSKLSTVDSVRNFNNGSLTNLCVGFPIITKPNSKIRWGASFGLVPFSRVEYSLLHYNDTSLLGYRSYDAFNGNGSLYKFYLGTGVGIRLDSFMTKPYNIPNDTSNSKKRKAKIVMDRINLGVNSDYIFGSLYQSDVIAFPDTFNAYNTEHQYNRTLGGIMFQGGFQFVREFFDTATKSNLSRIVIGFSGNLQSGISGTINELWDRYVFNTNLPGSGVKDTILANYNQHGKVVLPASFSFGMAYNKYHHYLVGVNIDYSQWANYSSFGVKDTALENSWRVAVGGEWTPKSKNYYNAFNYRLGISYSQDYIRLYNTPLHQFAITFGVGIPLPHTVLGARLSFPKVNASIELGERGTLQNQLLKEDYIKFTVGFVLNDRWFIPRKFD